MVAVSVLEFAVALVLLLYLQAEGAPSTTEGVVAEVQAAAERDFNFIGDDLAEIDSVLYGSLGDDSAGHAANLSAAVELLYRQDVPANSSGYDPECLEELGQILQDTLQDMLAALESCGDLSHAAALVDSGAAQHEGLISNVTLVSRNLTALLAECSARFPPRSWAMVTCVFQQVATARSLLVPLWAEFRGQNRAAGAELLLLHLDTARCYRASLGLLAALDQSVRQEVAACRT